MDSMWRRSSPCKVEHLVPDPEEASTFLENARDTPGIAQRADVQVAYASALQPRPEDDVQFYEKAFTAFTGRPPKTLREDFAGTFRVSIGWAQRGPDCEAHAVDFDGPTLTWGVENYLRNEAEDVQKRVHVMQSDVLELPRPGMPLFDVICGNNYSHFTFKTPQLMETYLRQAYSSLASPGILVLDCYGGPEAHGTSVEEIASYEIPISGTETAQFDYIYEQATYDKDTRNQTVKVHFRFEDGSWMKNAFEYDWRVWDVSELTTWCVRLFESEDTENCVQHEKCWI